jgi:hypothetical protein
MDIINYNNIKKLITLNIDIIGLKTDSILYLLNNNNINNIIFDNFNINNELGCFKIEEDKDIPLKPLYNIENQYIKIYDDVNIIYINNEYDREELNNIFNNYNNLIVKASLPGCGKTTSLINYIIDTNKKGLFITPYNKLSQELRIKGVNAITLNMLLGINSVGENNKKGSYDVNNIDVIIFDEVYLNNYDNRQRINLFKLKYENIKYYATGDDTQLDAITDIHYNNVNNLDSYNNESVNFIFNNQITLNINKRLKTQEDKDILIQLKKEIFDYNTDVITTLKRYFKVIYNINDVNTTKNACYFNKTALKVNRYIHENVIKKPNNVINYKGVEYYIGLELICKTHLIIKNFNIDTLKDKKYITSYNKDITILNNQLENETDTKKIKNIKKEIRNMKDYIKQIKKEMKDKDKNNKIINVRLFKNYSYYISYIDTSFFTIHEKVEDIYINLPIDNITNFYLPYTFTTYALQGLSIDDKMTMFDADTCYVNRKFIWVLITRATELNNITLYLNSKEQNEKLKYSKIKQYFKIKINGYKHQDKIKNRNIIEDKYIDENYILISLDYFNYSSGCKMCFEEFYIDFDNDNNINSNISVNRLDNNIAHHYDNVEIICVDCNKNLSNKNMNIIIE